MNEGRKQKKRTPLRTGDGAAQRRPGAAGRVDGRARERTGDGERAEERTQQVAAADGDHLLAGVDALTFGCQSTTRRHRFKSNCVSKPSYRSVHRVVLLFWLQLSTLDFPKLLTLVFVSGLTTRHR